MVLALSQFARVARWSPGRGSVWTIRGRTPASAARTSIASDLPVLRETIPAAALFSNTDFESFDRTLTRALTSPPPAPLLAETALEVAARWLEVLQSATPVSTRVYTVSRDRKSMTETIIWAGTAMPKLETNLFRRIG